MRPRSAGVTSIGRRAAKTDDLLRYSGRIGPVDPGWRRIGGRLAADPAPGAAQTAAIPSSSPQLPHGARERRNLARGCAPRCHFERKEARPVCRQDSRQMQGRCGCDIAAKDAWPGTVIGCDTRRSVTAMSRFFRPDKEEGSGASRQRTRSAMAAWVRSRIVGGVGQKSTPVLSAYWVFEEALFHGTRAKRAVAGRSIG